MSSRAPAIASAGRIPVSRVLAESYATIFRNLWPFLQIALFPLTLSVLLPYLWRELYGPLYDSLVPLIGSDRAFWINSKKPAWFVERAVDWLVLILFMSHWLQFLAAREKNRRPVIVRLFSRTDLRMLRFGLLLTIAPLCSMIVRLAVFEKGSTLESLVQAMDVLQAASVSLVFVSVAADCLVAGRCAPVFAAAAIGQPMTLREAWQATRRQTLQLMLVWFVLFWLTRLLAGPAQSLADGIYRRIVMALYEPTEFIGSYYLPPMEQIVQLPSALLHLAAAALGAFVFHWTFRRDAAAKDALLQRFD